MVGTDKEVAFRKKRRDYTTRARSNPVREGTIVTVKKQARFDRPESILAKKKQINIDKKKFETNIKRAPGKNFPQPSEEDKFALVVRICPKKEYICNEAQQVLSEFRLHDQFDGVFVLLTEENRKKLKSVAHLIVYGVPTQEYINQLIHTHAFTVKDDVEVPVTSNQMVAEALSSKGIEFIADISHVIANVEEGFEEAALFLAPFHFSKFKVSKPRAIVSNGGISGWSADIQEFLSKIL